MLGREPLPGATSTALWLAAPSLFVIDKHAGPAAAIAWTAVLVLLLTRAGPVLVASIRRVSGVRPALVLGTAAFLVLALAFAVAYPYASAGIASSGFLSRLLRSEPSPNRPWPPQPGLSLVVLVPAVLNEFLTGSDLLTNSFYVGAFTLLLLGAASMERSTYHSALWAILLGVALASRAHLLLLLAPLARTLFLLRGSRGLALVGLVLLAVVGVTLPFVLGHTPDLTPLHTAAKLVSPRTPFPGQAEAVLLASAVAACVLALRLRTPEIAATIRASSREAATPVLLTALGGSAATGKPQFVILTFILPATVIATMARWIDWFGQPATIE